MKTIIHISGTSCVGKSTVYEYVRDAIKDSITVSFDQLKWNIIGYTSSIHRGQALEIVYQVFEEKCRENVQLIILDMTYRNEEVYKNIKSISDKYSWNIIEISLTASKDVLLERFRKRMESIKINGDKASVTSEDVFVGKICKDLYTPENAICYDTEEFSKEEIGEIIVKMIKG